MQQDRQEVILQFFVIIWETIGAKLQLPRHIISTSKSG
jgi:hypothetical protein